MSGTRRNFNFFPVGGTAAFGCLTPAYPASTAVAGVAAGGRAGENFLKRKVGSAATAAR